HLRQQAGLAVVQEVALAHRLDHQRVLPGILGGPGARGHQQAEGRYRVGLDDVGRDDRVLLAKLLGERPERVCRLGCEPSHGVARLPACDAPHLRIHVYTNAAPKASAAASTVRSMAASSWASETNQASNWEGGG